ncbi:unnamed protein product [Mytilus coruscus]|uniref:Uncharacterized protein n=1 Tax=Mytilus coruscus TaxID=42192 RepID=A0A6J8DRM9_MYTCO|nr:unnamed protein product [Mytilus coruscus]
MASNVVFQNVNKSGDIEFRVKFGRNKSLVYRKHEQFYYLDLYDNKFGKARFNGICLGLDEIDFLLSIWSDLDSLKTIFPAVKAAEESSSRIHQQEASSWVITHQPTTFAYPHPLEPFQPQAAAYRQTSAFMHPALHAIKQPPPSPPAGSQQIYQCQEAVPLSNYPQKRGLTSYSTDYDTEISSKQTMTPAVIDTGMKKNEI